MTTNKECNAEVSKPALCDIIIDALEPKTAWWWLTHTLPTTHHLRAYSLTNPSYSTHSIQRTFLQCVCSKVSISFAWQRHRFWSKWLQPTSTWKVPKQRWPPFGKPWCARWSWCWHPFGMRPLRLDPHGPTENVRGQPSMHTRNPPRYKWILYY